MLLAVDVGNTEITIGLFESEKLRILEPRPLGPPGQLGAGAVFPSVSAAAPWYRQLWAGSPAQRRVGGSIAPIPG